MELGDRSRYLVNASAGGFSSEVSSGVSSQGKNRWGILAYPFVAAKTLPQLNLYEMELSFDDGHRRSMKGYASVVANGSFIAGGIPLVPGALLDDGLLDVVLFPEAPLSDLLRLLKSLVADEEVTGNEMLYHHRARRVELTAEPAFSVNADGETCGQIPVRYEVLPSALLVQGSHPAHPD
jgi:diacylglycerol kinase (ATP)